MKQLNTCQDMPLYTYFKKKTGDPTSNHLPDVKGTLSKIVPTSYIIEANKEVSAATNTFEKRSPYLKLTPEKKPISENMLRKMESHLQLDVFLKIWDQVRL